GGRTWSSQLNQPTSEFYRVTVDNQFPYRVYGAQQDNSTASVSSRSSARGNWQRDLYSVGGCECGYIAVHPDDADIIYAGCYGGSMTIYDHGLGESRSISVYPENPMGSGADVLPHRFLFALSHWRILPRWQASLNLRQTFVSGFDAPFAPSLGTTYYLIDQPTQQLQAKATVSRSYRIPNLNAMYWEPGGNPDIRSETGTNWEGGLRYKKEYKDQLQFDVEATYYQMNVQDWILWQPISSYWSPINLREVNVQGVELQATGQGRLTPTTKLRLSGNYAYTKSTNKISESNGETIHRQLPYVPFHRVSFTTGLEIKGFWLTGNTHYTDVRFTTTNNEQYIDGFVLTNLQLGKHFSYNKHAFTLSFDVNNIFDTNYRNVGNQAMPLRNYLLTFRYQLN
ncbi:MAG: TonB-dependent receptor, partial [Bacteroidota bacterium]